VHAAGTSYQRQAATMNRETDWQ